jgi:hypothetical protein
MAMQHFRRITAVGAYAAVCFVLLGPAFAQTAVDCATRYEADKMRFAAAGITAGAFIDACLRGQVPSGAVAPPAPQINQTPNQTSPSTDVPLGAIRTYKK